MLLQDLDHSGRIVRLGVDRDHGITVVERRIELFDDAILITKDVEQSLDGGYRAGLAGRVDVLLPLLALQYLHLISRCIEVGGGFLGSSGVDDGDYRVIEVVDVFQSFLYK